MDNKIYVFEGGSIVYDGSTLTEEQKSRAVAVDKLPEPEEIEGKIPVIRANLKTQEVYYEYIDKPQDPLEKRVEELQAVVDSLVLTLLTKGEQ